MMRWTALLVTVHFLVAAELSVAAEIWVLPRFHVEYGEFIEGDITSVSIEGVEVRAEENGTAIVLPWFAVDSMGGDWRVPSGYLVVAKNSRLGYGRRIRGDLSGCALMYRTIAPRLVGSDSEMGREVFRGLLDEALSRGDLYDASVAYRAYALSKGELLDEIDERYGIHVGIPMIPGLSHVHGMNDVAARLSEFEEIDSSLFDRLKLLNDAPYVVEPDSVLLNKERKASGEQTILGRELYLNMFAAQMHPDQDSRVEARRWLQSRAESKAGTWIDLWCRLAIGSSYIRESNETGDDSMCSLGVVHLLHAVVRFESEYPMLANAARELGAHELIRQGRYKEAAELFGGIEY